MVGTWVRGWRMKRAEVSSIFALIPIIVGSVVLLYFLLLPLAVEGLIEVVRGEHVQD